MSNDIICHNWEYVINKKHTIYVIYDIQRPVLNRIIISADNTGGHEISPKSCLGFRKTSPCLCYLQKKEKTLHEYSLHVKC